VGGGAGPVGSRIRRTRSGDGRRIEPNAAPPTARLSVTTCEDRCRGERWPGSLATWRSPDARRRHVRGHPGNRAHQLAGASAGERAG
jgi:hypothetical protein